MKTAYGTNNDTIFAPATPFGKSALAIVRVSGPAVAQVLLNVCRRIPDARVATLCKLYDVDGFVIDQAIVLHFPAGMSPTGEDVAEFHLHGNSYLVGALCDALGASEGLRLAQPGEFTRRAVLAGKLDFTGAEALADLMDAETLGQRRQAIRQLYGSVADPVIGWRDRLLDALSLMEADIDFSDEGDVAGIDLSRQALDEASTVVGEMSRALQDSRVGERLREGFNVVIAGPPNAGKSTLLNYLAGRDVAIVTDIPGTTRDILEVKLDLGGIPVRLVDTAGIRESFDTIEVIGIKRSMVEMGDADIIVWLQPCNTVLANPNSWRPDNFAGDVLTVGTKIDIPEAVSVAGQEMGEYDQLISAATGDGVDQLVDRISNMLPKFSDLESVTLTRTRHRAALSEAIEALNRLPQRADDDDWERIVLWAEDLRSAIFQLGSVTGHSRSDDVLDRIFSSFCIGK